MNIGLKELILKYIMKEKPYLIGIAGGSGSGKTTLIRELKKEFSKKEICVISLDDYYYPKKKQKVDHKGIVNFDLPTAINKKDFLADLKLLINGKPCQRIEYTFNNKKAKPKKITLRPTRVIIVEGLFIFHYKKINALLNLKVFVHAKENIKLIRRIIRDKTERNYPLEDVLYRYEHHVLPSFEKYIEPYRESADLVINNNKNYNEVFKMLQVFIKSKI